jgi:hypothetical protein
VAAALNGAKGLELLKVKAPSIPIQEAVALRAEDDRRPYADLVGYRLNAEAKK